MNKHEEQIPVIRLDLWLWGARFYKTRSIAKSAIESGKVHVAGQDAKPSRPVRVGEQLQVRRGDELFDIEVLAIAGKRGSASVAQKLYRESEESIARRVAEREKKVLERDGYQAPEHKPDKRARKLIRALGDLDAL